jgi:beta-lactamase superfamily II metal-dependent hydrolase
MTPIRVLTLALAVLLLKPVSASKAGLEIYFIDVEGGQATLLVSPAHESLLVDAGYGRTSRDPDRILAAVREAQLVRIDYMLVTHFHNDHVGGVPELASRIPIGTFVDYGEPLGTPFGADRLSLRAFSLYEPIRTLGRRLTPRPGDRLPLAGVETTVVSAGGALVSAPLRGGGKTNDACSPRIDHPDDGTENFRSIGVVVRYGEFRFVNLGDLSGNTLSSLVCPNNLLGEASAYLIAHHGDYDSNHHAVYAALQPSVAIMNNGVAKGGDPATFATVHGLPGMELWQLHASGRPRAQNAPDRFIANLHDNDQDCVGHWIKLTAWQNGSFTVTNGRTGFARTYSSKR